MKSLPSFGTTVCGKVCSTGVNDMSILNVQIDVLLALAGSNAMIYYAHVANFIVAVFNFEKHGYEDNHTT